MSGLLKRETLVGWAFFALGYFLIHWSDLVVNDLLHLHWYAFTLFPATSPIPYFVMAFGLFGLLAAAGLSCVTGWGAGHKRSWSRWTGLFPCLYLLPGFPYLTPLGILGLYYLWKQPTAKPAPLTAAEFWNSRRQSGWMLTASILGWFAGRLAFTGLQRRAYLLGLPVLDLQGPGIPLFLVLVWLQIALHECGHALAAVLVGFRVKVLAIGPLVFSNEPGGRRLQFQWRGLLLPGGYMGA